MTSFTAQISNWVTKSERNIEAVVKESSQRVISTMQEPRASGGRMPVDTGFLRASLVPSLNIVTVSSRENPDTGFHNFDNNQVALKLAGLELGDTFYAVYAANYAAAQNYGTQGRAPAGFVEGAAAQWQTIVNSVTLELQARLN